MAGTRSLHDCQTLVNAIAAAQGGVPDVLGYILSAARLSGGSQRQQRPSEGHRDAAVVRNPDR